VTACAELRVCVVGVGHIGSSYLPALAALGHQVITVDIKGHAEHLTISGVPYHPGVDVWVIATPTQTHLDVLLDILTRNPAALVLLEKPAVRIAELGVLETLGDAHPEARIVVSDLYAHSAAVRAFADSVRSLTRNGGDLRTVTIEFTKNRAQDEDQGRFVDADYGPIGYEWFHLLSILRQVLPARMYQRWRQTGPAELTDASLVPAGTGLPEIRLYSSVAGQIGHPALGRPFVASAEGRRYLAAAQIPYGAQFRYRIANAETESGATATLVFEPFSRWTRDSRNKHTVHVRDGANRVSTVVHSNHLAEALGSQLSELVTRSNVQHRLHLAEHEFLRQLAEIRTHPVAVGSPAGGGKVSITP
jgi:predicted dehydrogenase